MAPEIRRVNAPNATRKNAHRQIVAQRANLAALIAQIIDKFAALFAVFAHEDLAQLKYRRLDCTGAVLLKNCAKNVENLLANRRLLRAKVACSLSKRSTIKLIELLLTFWRFQLYFRVSRRSLRLCCCHFLFYLQAN